MCFNNIVVYLTITEILKLKTVGKNVGTKKCFKPVFRSISKPSKNLIINRFLSYHNIMHACTYTQRSLAKLNNTSVIESHLLQYGLLTAQNQTSCGPPTIVRNRNYVQLFYNVHSSLYIKYPRSVDLIKLLTISL